MEIQRQTEDVQKWLSFDGNQVFQEFAHVKLLMFGSLLMLFMMLYE